MSNIEKDETVDFLESLLLEDTTEMGQEELDREIAECGRDAAGLRKRIADSARKIAAKERRRVGEAPVYLRDVSSQLDSKGALTDDLEEGHPMAGEGRRGSL